MENHTLAVNEVFVMGGNWKDSGQIEYAFVLVRLRLKPIGSGT